MRSLAVIAALFLATLLSGCGLLPEVKDPVAYDLMRVLKKTLDPNNILNPGKVV